MGKEYIDEYNLDKVRTGRIVDREDKSQLKGYYQVVQVIIFNAAGEILLQQRQTDTDKKDYWAGLWDLSACGCSLAGESSRMAAIREVKEELGIDLSQELKDAFPDLTTSFHQGFTDIFIVNKDVDLLDVHVQKEEVKAVRYGSREEILQLMEYGLFVPYMKSWIEFLFDLRENGKVFYMP